METRRCLSDRRSVGMRAFVKERESLNDKNGDVGQTVSISSIVLKEFLYVCS